MKRTRLVVPFLLLALLPLIDAARGQQPPAPVLVRAGGDARTAIQRGGDVRLERGASFNVSSTIGCPPGLRLSSFGDESKPDPQIRVTSAVSGLLVNNAAGVRIRDVDVEYVGSAPPRGSGLQILNSRDVQFTDGRLAGFRMNLSCEAYGVDAEGRQRRCTNVYVAGNVIEGSRGGTGHSSGVFVSYTDAFVLEGNVFDGNGAPATVYNHNAYLHSTTREPVVIGNTFVRASSHGLQQRGGGECVGNVFLDNPIGASVGHLNGNPVPVPRSGDPADRGVVARVEGNLTIGGGAIAGSPRGWAWDLANARSIEFRENVVAHDTLRQRAAICVPHMKDIENPAQLRPPAEWRIVLGRNYVQDWPKGPLRVELSAPTLEGGGAAWRDGAPTERALLLLAPPPVVTDLRAAIGGASFVAAAKADPRNAASRAIERARKAAGLDKGTPPPPDEPTTQPTTRPTLETLEAVIRTRPQDLRAVLEGGRPVLRVLTPGADPVYDVAGDTIKRR